MFSRCRGAGWLGFLFLLTGCRAHSEPGFPDASSGARSEESGPQGTTTRPVEKWADFRAVLSWPSATSEPFLSHGHGAPRYEVDLRVNSEARSLYGEWVAGAVMPAGTTIAELWLARETGERGLYGMRKQRDGGWAFIIADMEGRLLDDGASERCARCHAEAVSDFVFGLPEAIGGNPTHRAASQ